MSWRTLPPGQALDLDTLAVGDRVRMTAWSKDIPVIELEKLSREVVCDRMDWMKIVDASGEVLKREFFHSYAGELREHLASRYFRVNGDEVPVLRILCAKMYFRMPPQEILGDWSSVRVKTVEIWAS